MRRIKKFGKRIAFEVMSYSSDDKVVQRLLSLNPYNVDNICNFHMLPKSSLTNLIYWQDESDYLTWSSYLKSYFPVGVLLIGCKKTGYKEAVSCLKEKLPLFVFNKSGGSASIISKHINEINSKNCKRDSSDVYSYDYDSGDECNDSDKKIISLMVMMILLKK